MLEISSWLQCVALLRIYAYSTETFFFLDVLEEQAVKKRFLVMNFK